LTVTVTLPAAALAVFGDSDVMVNPPAVTAGG
jgi:hypothetical protein